MTLRTPYEFSSDEPSGALKISVADPIDSAFGDSTYYLAKRFSFTEGNYTLRIKADDAATLWIGTTQTNSRMIASCILPDAGTAYVNIPLGDYRIDVILQNLPPEPSPCFFELTILRGEDVVYTSTKAGWMLDDAPISDDDLPPVEDYRYKLPMFTLRPNWKNGVLERLNWTTDVLGSETDAEQRRSVRRNARRSFEVSFGPRSTGHPERNMLDTFLVGIGSSKFMMPLWHEAVKLLDGLDMEASGVYFADGELYAREFRTGDLVLVNAGDPSDYDILEVGDVETMRFSWAFPPPRSWPPGTQIFPMRIARVADQAPTMQNITDTKSTATVRFELAEPYEVTPAWGSSAGGQPFFKWIPDRTQTVDVQYGRKSYTLDNDSGVPATVDHGRFTATTLSIRLFLHGRKNAYNFRQFLQAARGQAKHFFMPTFMEDVTLNGDIPEGSIDLAILPQGFYQFMLRPQPVRIQLAFQFRNGAQAIYRTITNVREVYKTDPDGTIHTPAIVVGELLTLDEVMPEIKLSALKRVSFVAETRFLQDGFELQHATNQQEVVTTSLVFRQYLNQRTTV